MRETERGVKGGRGERRQGGHTLGTRCSPYAMQGKWEKRTMRGGSSTDLWIAGRNNASTHTHTETETFAYT